MKGLLVTRFLGVFPIALASCLLAGCGDGSRPPAPLAKVSGTVNLDGKPMAGGEVRFAALGEVPRVLPVTNGAFSGEASVGSNAVEVVWDKEGDPNPMDPSSRLMTNAVDAKFSGPATPFREEIGAAGASDLKFDVTSAK